VGKKPPSFALGFFRRVPEAARGSMIEPEPLCEAGDILSIFLAKPSEPEATEEGAEGSETSRQRS
jgi:hypothetical protein